MSTIRSYDWGLSTCRVSALGSLIVLRLVFGGRFQNVPLPKSFPLRLFFGSEDVWPDFICSVEVLLVGDWLEKFLLVEVSSFLVFDTAPDDEIFLVVDFGWSISKNACLSKSDWFRDAKMLLGGLTLLDSFSGAGMARSMCCAIWFCNFVTWSFNWSMVCWPELNRLSLP